MPGRGEPRPHSVRACACRRSVTLPSSLRAARRRPVGLSASSRIRSPAPRSTASAAGLRSSAASRLLRVARESSRLTPSRANRSERSRRGSASACAPRRCAIAAVSRSRRCSALGERHGARGDRGEEQHQRRGEQAAESPVRPPLPRGLARRGCAALLEELALELVERCRSPPLSSHSSVAARRGAAVELARLASSGLPLRRRQGQMAVQTTALRVLLEPGDESRPLLDQGLVHEFDGAVVGDEQPPLDERREHARDARVVLGVELVARHAPPRERLALAARRRAGAGSGARSLCSSSSSDLNAASACRPTAAADAAGPLVARERQRATVALAPEVEQRRREERQPAGLAGDVVDERVDERRLDLESDPLGRPLDRAPQLGRAHRPEQDVVRSDEVRELDVRRERPKKSARSASTMSARAPGPTPRRRARRRTHAARPRRPTVRRAPRAGRRRARAARPCRYAFESADEARPADRSTGAHEHPTLARAPAAGRRGAATTCRSRTARRSRAAARPRAAPRARRRAARGRRRTPRRSASNGARPLNGQTVAER